MREHENKTGTESVFTGLWAARALTDATEHSRAYMEKSLRAFQDETAQLLNRRIDHNNAALTECQNSKDLADFVNAQHKWFADLNRDYFDAWMRISETTQRIIADGASHATEQDEKAMHGVREDIEHRTAAE